LEILVVVSIMTLSVFLMAPEFTEHSDDQRTQQTQATMGEIRKAILGTPSPRLGEALGLAGYLPDMGAMPNLIDGQPVGLWRSDLNGDGVDDLLPHHIHYASYSTTRASDGGAGYGIALGWRGPYLKSPEGDALKDAWGNPIQFQYKGHDFVIRSLGADGRPGGQGNAGDMVITIRDRDYLTSVAGYVSPNVIYKSKDDLESVGKSLVRQSTGTPPVKVRIYYRPNPHYEGVYQTIWKIAEGGLLAKEVPADADGYFCFHGENRIPIGAARMLVVVQGGLKAEGAEFEIFHPYKIAVRPEITWLGRMGSIP
jgi:hypothetical protein